MLEVQTEPKAAEYDAVIIGGGPGGWQPPCTAHPKACETMVVEREAPGGQAGTSSRIENYLGFPSGVSGDELAKRALQQADRLGAEIVVTRSVERIDAGSRHVHSTEATCCARRPLWLAFGVTWRRLAIELDRLTGNGVYYGASRSEASDHPRPRHLTWSVQGTRPARLRCSSHSCAERHASSRRGDSLEKSMSQYLIRPARDQPQHPGRLRTQSRAHGATMLEALDITDRSSGETTRLSAVGGLFVFIGADAAPWLPAEIALDPRGFVLTGVEARAAGCSARARPVSARNEGARRVRVRRHALGPRQARRGGRRRRKPRDRLRAGVPAGGRDGRGACGDAGARK